MRSFYAIDIPENIKKELVKIQEHFNSAGFDFNFTTYDNFHITLMFLGECRDIESTILTDILKSKIMTTKFKISLNGISLFKNGKIPKIIYVDITDGANFLTEINELIFNHSKHILARNELENNFKPHLTLGRIGHFELFKIKQLEKAISEINVDFSFPVEKISLFESILSEHGAVYILKDTIVLK